MPARFIDVRESVPSSPILISVPHAGRHYPPDMANMARLSVSELRILEDRHADSLVKIAAQHGYEVLIADTARAWIDLNRAEHEMERSAYGSHGPGGMVDSTGKCLESIKARGGLGLIPTRLHPTRPIWRAPLSPDDVAARVAQHHAPWHATIESALEARRRRFGHAILLDVHSMPPLSPSRMSGPPARIVIGDLFGRSASRASVDILLSEARAAGFVVSRNHPYAGGYTLERHGRPARGIQAIQLEFCRTLYLDSALDQPSPNLATIQNLLLRMVKALEAYEPAVLPIAAE